MIISKKSNLAKFKKPNLIKTKNLDYIKTNSFKTDILIPKANETFIHL